MIRRIAMSEEQRLIRLEGKIDRLIEVNSGQNERIAKIEAHQKIVSGFTMGAFGAAAAAFFRAFFGGHA